MYYIINEYPSIFNVLNVKIHSCLRHHRKIYFLCLGIFCLKHVILVLIHFLNFEL